MRNQLIPPPDQAPPSIKHLPLEKRIALWAELVDESEALLLARLRERIGPAGDLKQAYREWHVRHNEDRERMIPCMAENSRRRMA